MSSNDFDGPGAGNRNGSAQTAGGERYPAPEGWETGGFWRDSSIDSDYETNLQSAVPPAGPRRDLGHSYFADGRGWENSPADNPAGAAPGLPGAAYGGSRTAVYSGPGGSSGYGYGPAGPAAPVAPPLRPGGPGGPQGPGKPGKKVKRKGSWWRHWSWKKVLALLGSFFLLIVLALVGVYEELSHSATIPPALASANYQNSTVYYADGKTAIGTIGELDRQNLTYKQIPVMLQNAVLAAEDKNFWTEGGISPAGILRSAYGDLMNGGTAGGSTITQEFVRNYYANVGVQQTVSRKIKEIFIAQKLAKERDKKWILTHYLNLIYLGEKSYGVAAAAQTYFGKPVSQLTVSQDVVLASIIQQPSNYPQKQYRANLKARWAAVLSDMLKDHFITQAQYDQAKFPVLLTDSGSTGGTGLTTLDKNDPAAPYIMEVVQSELLYVDHVPQLALDTGGLKIVTTISPSMEAAMYKAVNDNIAAIKATPGASFPSYIRIGAEVQNPSNGEILAMYPGPGRDMSTKECKAVDCQLNTAIYTREQVGSSFKPYVLSAAVDDGMNVQTSILNAAPSVCVPTDNQPLVLSKQMKGYSTTQCTDAGLSSDFAVENDGYETIAGTSPKTLYSSTVQNALAQSSNTAFSDLAHRVTTGKVIDMAGSMGVNTADYSKGGSGLAALKGQVGLALGTASLTVNEQTTMLSTIDDDGVYHQAHIVKSWQQPDGPLHKATPVSRGVFDAGNSTSNAQLDSQVQYAMEQTTVDGTGTGAVAGLNYRPVIAKTGTSGTTSGFFIGAIKQYAMVVGIFTASQSSSTSQSLLVLSGGGFGGYWPAKIWNSFAASQFNNLKVENFQTPVFSGQKWNQVGKIPKKKKKVSCPSQVINGKKVKVQPIGKKCPAPKPTSSPTPTKPTTPTPHPTHTRPVFPTTSPSPTAPGSPTTSPTATPTSTGPTTGGPTTTPTGTASPTLGGGPPGIPNPGAAHAVSGTRAGLAVGGVLVALPSLLLWGTAARRRRKRRAGTAE